jgi:hypothetical protein
MTVIPATLKAEVGELIAVQGQPGQKHKTLSEKHTKRKRTGNIWLK